MEMASLSADRVLLLGPLQVIQNDVPLNQPPSRKVRALLGYLAMAPRPVTREKLCELFWDVADDPRSELRWCLSKLRPLVDRPTTTRIVADRKQVWIDTSSLDVDAQSVARRTQKTLADSSPSELRSLLALFRGDFLEGLSVDGAPSFENWLAGQRHRFGQLRQQLLERLSSVLAPESVADADSVTSDIIFGFAKLRGFSVIARGTAFSLRSLPPAAAAALVNAQYVASGHLRRDGKRYLVSVELIDPKSDRIFWVDEFSCNADDSFAVPPLLAARIITGLDAEIHVIERNRALLMPPASLDAWQPYHRGLPRMARFSSDGNREAHHFFNRAIALDPTFSRSYAGLSFTHFHNAFHLNVRESEREIALAFETAGQALMADPSDPAAHCAFGRAQWLAHAHDGAVGDLNQSIRLSPNYPFR